jgi:hypothetical protein
MFSRKCWRRGVGVLVVISKKFSGHTKIFSGHITFFPENDKNFPEVLKNFPEISYFFPKITKIFRTSKFHHKITEFLNTKTIQKQYKNKSNHKSKAIGQKMQSKRVNDIR